MRSFQTRLVALTLLSPLAACGGAADGPEGDPENASFGGGKADGLMTDCERIEVLKLVNESTSTVDRLGELDVRSNAAENIVAHRAGKDGVLGTRDDDRIDDLGELDAISFVGPVTLDNLIAGIGDRCEVDITSRPVIDAQTFGGSIGGGFARDNTELEAAMAVHGVSGIELFHLLGKPDDDGEIGFDDVRRSRDMEAFSYQYGVDEMPWNSSAHDVREAMPYVSLSIESGNFEPDEGGGERELRLGTDINDDFYFDTVDYRLLANEMSLRGRVRWDTADEVRRLLIAAKFGSIVGDDGVKRASKMDVRTFGGSHRGTLVEDVQAGTVRWEGSPTAVEPIRAIYESLAANGALQSFDGRDDLLVVDPKLFIRSVRSRYHLNLASISRLKQLADNGVDRIELVLGFAADKIADPGTDPAVVADLEALVAAGEALLDKTSIATAAEAGILAIDPGATVDAASLVLPADFPGSVSNHAALQTNRVIAEAVDAQYHAFGDLLDDVDRDLTGTRGLDGDEYVDMFIAWRKAETPSLAIKTIALPFYEDYEEIAALADADRQAQWDEFGKFADEQLAAGNDDFEDFQPLTDETWAQLGAHLQFEGVKLSQRQIEAAGTVGNAIWFDLAREFYVPSSTRPSGNFLIDTMDFAQMMTPEEWNSMTAEEQRIDHTLDPAKILHSTLVNEVQIELGFEDEYIDRIAALDKLVAEGTATDEDVRDLEGANFVFGRFQAAMATVAELKGDDMLDGLDDLGAPGSIEWAPASHAKGDLGLLLITGAQ